MSLLVLSFIGIVVLALVGGVCALFIGTREWRLDEAIAPAPPARKPRGPLADGFCPVCHAPGVYLTKAGGPNRRYHTCEPPAVQAHVWPPAPADQPTGVAP